MKRLIPAILLAVLAQCRQPTQSQQGEGFPNREVEAAREDQIQQSRARLAEERKYIEQFLESRKLMMERTGNGLYYLLEEADTNPEVPHLPTPGPGDVVWFSYNSYLLDGTLAYKAESENPRKLKLFKEDAEMGIHEALTLMHEGQEGQFVLPSHLAFGVGGDQEKIPPYSPVYYRIKVLKIEFNP